MTSIKAISYSSSSFPLSLHGQWSIVLKKPIGFVQSLKLEFLNWWAKIQFERNFPTPPRKEARTIKMLFVFFIHKLNHNWIVWIEKISKFDENSRAKNASVNKLIELAWNRSITKNWIELFTCCTVGAEICFFFAFLPYCFSLRNCMDFWCLIYMRCIIHSVYEAFHETQSLSHYELFRLTSSICVISTMDFRSDWPPLLGKAANKQTDDWIDVGLFRYFWQISHFCCCVDPPPPKHKDFSLEEISRLVSSGVKLFSFVCSSACSKPPQHNRAWLCYHWHCTGGRGTYLTVAILNRTSFVGKLTVAAISPRKGVFSFCFKPINSRLPFIFDPTSDSSSTWYPVYQ